MTRIYTVRRIDPQRTKYARSLGIDTEEYVIRLRLFGKLVKKKDGYRCKKCNCHTGLTAHHIIPKSEDISKVFDVDNGMTLCARCHRKIHE